MTGHPPYPRLISRIGSGTGACLINCKYFLLYLQLKRETRLELMPNYTLHEKSDLHVLTESTKQNRHRKEITKLMFRPLVLCQRILAKLKKKLYGNLRCSLLAS